jgi:hypothetical protein
VAMVRHYRFDHLPRAVCSTCAARIGRLREAVRTDLTRLRAGVRADR